MASNAKRKYEVFLDPEEFSELAIRWNSGNKETLLENLFNYAHRNLVINGDEFYMLSYHRKEVDKLKRDYRSLQASIDRVLADIGEAEKRGLQRRICPECRSHVAYRRNTDMYNCGKCGWVGPVSETVVDSDF